MQDESTTNGERNHGHFKSAASRAKALSNLKSWTSDNNPRGGRPGKTVFMEEIERVGRTPVPRDREKRSHYRALAEKLWQLALRGNVTATVVLLDRICGKLRYSDEPEMPAEIHVHINKNVQRFPDTPEAHSKVLEGKSEEPKN